MPLRSALRSASAKRTYCIYNACEGEAEARRKMRGIFEGILWALKVQEMQQMQWHVSAWQAAP
jgi:hypothetical protein